MYYFLEIRHLNERFLVYRCSHLRGFTVLGYGCRRILDTYVGELTKAKTKLLPYNL